MPAKYFICPDGGQIEIEVCLSGKCRLQGRCAPLSYLQLAGTFRPWTGKPSVTQLIQGTREAYLKIKNDYAIDPLDRAYAVLGTSAHAALENRQNDFSFIEESIEIEGITGRSDNLERQADGSWVLWDHKTAGSFKVAKALGIVMVPEPIVDEQGNPILLKSGKNKGQPKTKKVPVQDPDAVDIDDWMLQDNMYRIALERYIKEPISRLRNWLIVRDGGTWMARNRGIDKKAYAVDISILPDEMVLDYFKRKRDSLLESLKRGSSPPICSDAECWSGNKCKDYCDVSHLCADNPYMLSDIEEVA